MDDRSKTGKADRDRINVNEAYELSNWAKQLGVTEAKLKEAVSKVGFSVVDVKKYLGKQ